MKKNIVFTLAAVLFCLFSFNTQAQKAYDIIYYKGTTQNISIVFSYANGYFEGCEIETRDLQNNKKSLFVPTYNNDFTYDDERKELFLYHLSKSDKTFSDYFIIDNIEYDYEDHRLPDSFTGAYYFNGQEYPFKIKRVYNQ